MNIHQALKYASSSDKVIGLYFSASYCKYCTTFTPMLQSAYPRLRELGIEIILVGSDKTEEAFEEYRKDHPWKHIDYNDEIRPDLRTMYGIKTIPALVFLDKDGKLITDNGRNLVVESNENPNIIASKLGQYSFEYNSDDEDF